MYTAEKSATLHNALSSHLKGYHSQHCIICIKMLYKLCSTHYQMRNNITLKTTETLHASSMPLASLLILSSNSIINQV